MELLQRNYCRTTEGTVFLIKNQQVKEGNKNRCSAKTILHLSSQVLEGLIHELSGLGAEVLRFDIIASQYLL